MPDPIQLDAKIRIEDQRIVVDYSIANTSEDDLLVFNALYTLQSGQVIVDKNRVYTVLDGQVLALTKAALPIPPGLQLEIPDVPYATKLDRGGKLQEEVAVGLPVEYYNPHDQVLEEQTVECKGVRFRVGYARLADIDPAPEAIRVDSRDLFRVKYRAALQSQRLVESDESPAEIKVIKRP